MDLTGMHEAIISDHKRKMREEMDRRLKQAKEKKKTAVKLSLHSNIQYWNCVIDYLRKWIGELE